MRTKTEKDFFDSFQDLRVLVYFTASVQQRLLSSFRSVA